MAAPNIVNVTTIIGKTAYATPANTTENVLLANTAGSGKVLKINQIVVANVDLTSQITGTLPIANGGTGLSSLGTAGQALVVNSGATALEYGSAGVSTGKAIAMAIVFG